MIAAARCLQIVALLLVAAIAGFFYAYWSSVMIGLAATMPETGMAAMQAINATVRNVMFAPSFFGPVLVLPLAVIVNWRTDDANAARWLLAAWVVYMFGAFGVTILNNVPLNAALASQPATGSESAAIWTAYLADWSWWNGCRTLASFLALTLIAMSLLSVRSVRL